jgi:AraC family transcriptional regulator
MLNAVLSYINNHLEENISLEHLARLTGYSSFHLHRLLREELNEPIASFIIKQRMQKAAYLLYLTNLPVTEVRCLVGYDNDSSFSRTFKKFHGCSPKDYRKKESKNHSIEDAGSYVSLNSEVVRLPEQAAIVFPTIGNYFSRDTYTVWEKAEAYIKEQGLPEDNFTYYGILHDCQTLNETNNCRYDAAILPKKEMKLPGYRFFGTKLPAGKFIKYKFCCTISQYQETAAVINQHLYEMNLQHKQGASYFKFHQLPRYQVQDNLFIEWLIPIH